MNEPNTPAKSIVEMINWLFAVVQQKAKELNCDVSYNTEYYPEVLSNYKHVLWMKFNPAFVSYSTCVRLDDENYETQIKRIAGEINKLQIEPRPDELQK